MTFKKFARRHPGIFFAVLESILRREYACQPLMVSCVEMFLLVSLCGWMFM